MRCRCSAAPARTLDRGPLARRTSRGGCGPGQRSTCRDGIASPSTATRAPSSSTRTPPRLRGCAPHDPRPQPSRLASRARRPHHRRRRTSRCWPTSPPASRRAGRSRPAPSASVCCDRAAVPDGDRLADARAARGRSCARCSRCCAATRSPCALLDFTHDKVPPFLRGHRSGASSLACCSSTPRRSTRSCRRSWRPAADRTCG